MAQAIVFTELGAPSVLHAITIDDPVPGAGEVVVRIEAAGVNPLDAKQRSGLRPTPPIVEPRRVGFDGAGIISAVGEGVTEFSIGDRVAVFNTPGTYATHVVAAEGSLALLDDAVTYSEGAALGIPAGTAYQVARSLDFSADDTVLVHGGSGAVGQALVQFAVAAGATVVATASERRHDRMRAIGAIPVTYGEGLQQRVVEAAPQGVTVAVDCIGTDEAIEVSKAVVADHNRVATIVRGPDAAQLGIRAFSGGSPVPLTDQEEQWRIDAVSETIALITQKKFSVEFGEELPMSQAPRAHELMEAGASGGKIILRPEF
ncbi:quinone oxidoreductase family protein [Microbacterium sp. YY-01]|uniref:quinone oxidoreductase family protein n=1 Tax=Microbacterium sp. YY-01 TaxID=3421634 RepID=UPI003D183D2A